MGERYIQQARVSVSYLRRVEPTIPTCLVTNCSNTQDLESEFDYIFEHPNPTYSFDDKIAALSLTPFEKTVYLDCDTLAITQVAAELSLILDSYDLFARPGMSLNEDWETKELSSIYPQFNAGVIGLNSQAIHLLLPKWRQYLEKYPGAIDQAHFRLACFSVPIRIFPLTSDWNFMGFDTIVNEVKIVHFANVRARNVFSKKRIERGLRLRLQPAGTLCIYWRPVWGERIYLANLVIASIRFTFELLRTKVARRGITRKRMKSIFLVRWKLRRQ